MSKKDKIPSELMPNESGLFRVEGQRLKSFCQKHRLKAVKIKCKGCDRPRRTIIPFYSKHYFRLIAPYCECGDKTKYIVSKPRSKEKKEFWEEVEKTFFPNLQ